MESEPADAPSAPDDVSPEVQEIRDILGMGDEESLGEGVPMESAPKGTQMEINEDGVPDITDTSDDLDDIFNAPGVTEDHQSVDEVMSDLDPEPIPDVFSAPTSFAKKKKKSSGGMWFFIILLLLCGILAGAWFMRAMVVEHLPAAEKVYQMIDELPFLKSAPGDGIVLEDKPKFEMQAVDGVKALVILGTMVNTTSKVIDVPNLKLNILDGTGEIIQFTIGPPPAPSIGPGEKMQYSIAMKNPAGEAASFKIDLTEEPVSGQAAPAKSEP